MEQPGELKFTDKLKDMFIELVADRIPRTAASRQVGISHATLYRHLKRDDQFRSGVLYAESKGVIKAWRVVNLAVDEGNLSAAQWFIKHRDPDFHNPPQMIEIDVGGTVEHKHSLDSSADRLAAVLALLAGFIGPGVREDASGPTVIDSEAVVSEGNGIRPGLRALTEANGGVDSTE